MEVFKDAPKLDELISKSVNGITIQLYANLIASNFTTDIYSRTRA